MKSFAYARPESIEEAIALLGEDTRLLAGGTDLLTLMKDGISSPAHLLDIKRLPDLSREITIVGDEIVIGALVTLADLGTNPVIREHLPALTEAVAVAASPQLRNMATVGGNVLQRPRCWYFRDEDVPCWLKGGDQCFARGGENQYHGVIDVSPCVAAHPSDLAPVLIAYGARVQVRDTQGFGEIMMDDFFRAPEADRRIEHVLPNDAVITGLAIPLPSADVKGTYLKAMDRKAWAFALAGVAVVLEVRRGVVADSRIVLGGVAPVPQRATEAEHVLLGTRLSEDVAAEAAEAAVGRMVPLEHNGYKVPLIRGLVTRALMGMA
jgi:xanthine dehydrogenase YagS FAD-binding subunit